MLVLDTLAVKILTGFCSMLAKKIQLNELKYV